MPKLKPLTKAKRLLENARYDKNGCMCGACVNERQALAFKDGVQLVYPGLKELPMGLSQLAYDGYMDQLGYLTRLKRRVDKTLLLDDGVERHQCVYCGDYHSDGKKHGKYWICQHCSYDVFLCADCGKLRSTENQYVVLQEKGNRETVCNDCYNNNYERCGSCHNGAPKGTLEPYPYKRNERGELVYMHLCGSCSAKGMTECRICGGTTHQRVAKRHNGKFYCPSCYEEEVGLNGHQYKPLKLRFKRAPLEGKVSENAFHMGFELEIARDESFISTEAMTHLVKEKMGKTNVYCVHDGTIQRATGREGFEIVSHPFTWEHYRKVGSLEWDKLLMFLRYKGWKASYGGVGFHVHTTKSAWGTHQIYKLMKLIYGNKGFVHKIAQRKPTDYCFMNPDDFDEAILVAKDKKNRKRNHYSAINLNSGKGAASMTIEFRIFQGTLEPLYFHKNIEFVKSCYEFTREHSSTKKKDYLGFLTDCRREYPCLSEFIKMKGIE